MFERIARSWELVKASWSVLQADKELIMFPIVSTLASIAVFVAFAIPMAAVGVFENISNGGEPGLFGYILAFLYYLVMSFVVIFSNSALVGAAMIRLRGGDPTVGDGFRIAMDHVGQIFGYALISATVGMILRWLREKGGLAGQIVAWLGNLAWGLATYLVIPVLVVEDIGPVEAIQRSAGLLKRTWGEQIVGNFSIGLIFGLLGFVAALLIGLPLILIAVAAGSVIAVVLAVGITVIVIAAIALVGSTLNGIYVAAVYRYAVEGEVNPQYFPPDLVEGAFRAK
jgi:hypothetical protein